MYPLKTVLINIPEYGLDSVQSVLDINQVHVEATFDNVNEAIEKWSWNDDDSRLVIFYIGALQSVRDLECLKRAFRWPILALVDAPREQIATLLILANRAGATQIVPLPLDAEDLRSAMDAICREHGYHGNEAKSVAVAGVTGGCGATTIAINLADAVAAHHHRHCVLAELAMQKGMLATYLNVEPQYVLPDLLQPGIKLDMHVARQALTRIADNFDIVSGAHFQITQVQASTQDLQRLIEHLQRLANVLVLDVPWTGDDHFLQILSTVNHVVLVAEQNLPSLRSLRLVLDMLNRSNLKATPGGLSVEVVVNRYDARSKDFPLARVKEVLDVPELVTVANDYPSVNASVNRGMPLRLGAPNSKALADITTLTRKLFGAIEAPPAAKSGGWNLFGRLANVFSGSST
jgi:pilus assembly protein CpaE